MSIHIGQAGCQMGNACWELCKYCYIHFLIVKSPLCIELSQKLLSWYFVRPNFNLISNTKDKIDTKGLTAARRVGVGICVH